MAKFKKGDRVRVVGGNRFDHGTIVTIDQDDSTIPYIRLANGSRDCVSQYELELVGGAFKVGDKVELLKVSSNSTFHAPHIGKVYTVLDPNCEWPGYNERFVKIDCPHSDGIRGYIGSRADDLKLVEPSGDVCKWDTVTMATVINKKEKSVMSSIVSKAKELLMSPEDRLLTKYEVIDACGNLTADGKEVLTQVLFEAYKADVVAKVKAVDAEEKAAKKGK